MAAARLLAAAFFAGALPFLAAGFLAPVVVAGAFFAGAERDPLFFAAVFFAGAPFDVADPPVAAFRPEAFLAGAAVAVSALRGAGAAAAFDAEGVVVFWAAFRSRSVNRLSIWSVSPISGGHAPCPPADAADARVRRTCQTSNYSATRAIRAQIPALALSRNDKQAGGHSGIIARQCRSRGRRFDGAAPPMKDFDFTSGREDITYV
ncbi:hypothetical protein [Algiphilus sp.]|uniref:hypothetical protein n=1 Tax=Algiphilus sp. TaxID=1872431 RepID=UPI0025BDE87A|nr:hypothetical protein [Algiphilus sp.]MCR9090921.1 hypothetical protein [Pseudomonadota bacterium]